MKNHAIRLPRGFILQIGFLFGFFLYNSLLVHLRGLIISIAFLATYYSCLGIQKLLLKV